MKGVLAVPALAPWALSKVPVSALPYHSAPGGERACRPPSCQVASPPLPSTHPGSAPPLKSSAEITTGAQQSGSPVFEHWLDVQASTVQSLPSSHWPADVQQPAMSDDWQLEATQVFVVQGSPSSHWASDTQQPGMFSTKHWLPMQEAFWQAPAESEQSASLVQQPRSSVCWH